MDAISQSNARITFGGRIGLAIYSLALFSWILDLSALHKCSYFFVGKVRTRGLTRPGHPLILPLLNCLGVMKQGTIPSIRDC